MSFSVKLQLSSWASFMVNNRRIRFLTVSIMINLIPYLAEIVADALPRFLLAMHEEGLNEMHLMMENPREFTMTNGQTVVFCTRSVMLFIYKDSTQVTFSVMPVFLILK